MQGIQKTIGVIVLATFILIAGSVICLASGEPNVMTDCGNHMSETAICPFMSVSIPTMTAISFGKEVAVILALTIAFIIVAAVMETDRYKTMVLLRHEHRSGRPSVSFLNPTLKLISQGILHPRIFGF